MPDLYKSLDDAKKKEIADYIHRKWDEARKSSLRQKVIEDMKEARDAYDQKPTSEELWDDAVNLVLPFMSISVDQLEPRLVASIAGHDHIVRVEDRGEMDEELSKDTEEMDNSVLLDDLKIKTLVKDHVHDVLLDGHVYLAPYWEFREGKIREWAKGEDGRPLRHEEGADTPEGMVPYAGKLMQERVETVRDRACLDTIDLEYLFFPDRIDDWEQTPIIHEHYLSWGEYQGKVKRGTKGWVQYDGDDLDDLQGKLFEKRPESGVDLQLGEPEDKGLRSIESEQLKSELRCLRGHICYDIDEDGIEEKLVCTIEETTRRILYLMDNAELDPLNRKQIRPIRLMPRSGTGYGYSLYSKLKMIQEGGSNSINLMLNSCIIQMMPFFFYEEAAGFNNKEIELYPGSGIQVGDVKRILMNSFQPNAGAFKDIIEIFFRLWQYIVVLPDYNVGREPAQAGSTATGTLALLQEASVSHDYLGSRLHDQYSEIFRIVHDLSYLNMSPAREIETLGREMSARVLSNSYKIALVSTTKAANRHIERMEMQEALMVAEKGTQAGVVVPDEPIRDYLEMFRGVNVEKWMNAPVSQVCARMRGTTNGQGQGEQGAIPDPFPELVMQLLQMPPEVLGELMNTLQIGKAVRDDVTELVTGTAGSPGEGWQ